MPSAGLNATWVDLIDVEPGDRVLLLDGGRQRARGELTARGALVSSRTSGNGRYDWICLDGVPLAERTLCDATARLAGDAGRLLIVIDNLRSPLRAADLAMRRPWGVATGRGADGLGRWLRSFDLEVLQHFVLLRSSAHPHTAMDVLAEHAVEAVTRASLSHVHGPRGVVLGQLPRLSPSTIAGLAPAWVLVSAKPGLRPEPSRVIGKIANRDSEEVKLIRGDPPALLEKRYHGAPPAAETAALRELESVGFGLAPRLVDLPDAQATLTTWLSGRPLVVQRLDDDELVTWTARAAEQLARLQRLTARPDGTVLVHGDLWLGNLLVDGDEVTGVVDWTTAHRGAPETDRLFLLESLLAIVAREHRLTPALRSRLAAAADPDA